MSKLPITHLLAVAGSLPFAGLWADFVLCLLDPVGRQQLPIPVDAGGCAPEAVGSRSADGSGDAAGCKLHAALKELAAVAPHRCVRCEHACTAAWLDDHLGSA